MVLTLQCVRARQQTVNIHCWSADLIKASGERERGEPPQTLLDWLICHKALCSVECTQGTKSKDERIILK